jgi:hypothetical protein
MPTTPDLIGILALTLVIIAFMRMFLPQARSAREKLTVLVVSALGVLFAAVVCYIALGQGVVTAVGRSGSAVLVQTDRRFWTFVYITYFIGVFFLSAGIAVLWPRKA